MPAYNEQARIGPTLERLAEYYGAQSYTWDITVVSDGSSDDTDRIVKDFCASHQGFKLHAYQPNRGKGYAVRYGALRSRGRAVLFSDADLSTPIEELGRFLPVLEQGCGVVIGSRALKESNLKVHQPWWRERNAEEEDAALMSATTAVRAR